MLKKYFDIKTIRGRSFLLAFFFVGSLLFSALVVVVQNRQVIRANEDVIDVRKPLVNTLTTLSENLNASASALKSFFLTKDERFREQRIAIWEGPLKASVVQLKNLSKDRDLRSRADTLAGLVSHYRRVQDSVENRFIAQIAGIDFGRAHNESAYAVRVIETEEQVEAFVISYLNDKEPALLSAIDGVLAPFRRQEERYMDEERNLINTQLKYTNALFTVLTLLIAIAGTVLAASVVSLVGRSLERPIGLIEELSRGELPENVPPVGNELDGVTNAGNRLAVNMSKASNFAKEIGKGNFNHPFEPASHGDILGNALVEMRGQLLAAHEEERRQRWAAEGLALFSEMLQHSEHTFEETTNNELLPKLIKYLSANQGALFVVNDSMAPDLSLDMIACYAYDTRKFLQKSIKINPEFAEGLLGEAFLEKATIHLDTLPNDYVSIASGLGQADPSHLIIVPLKANDQVEGMLEVASFNKFAPHDVFFAEKVGEVIALAISSAKASDKTRKLLAETQAQAEQMRSQEEEMRQNLEELMATQEAMARKEKELQEHQEEIERLKKIKDSQ